MSEQPCHMAPADRLAVGFSPQPGAALPGSIAAWLRRLIASGTLAPGTRLPGEQALARAFGVARPTLREALQQLAACGLIETRRGVKGGAVVVAHDWASAETALADRAAAVLDSVRPAADDARRAASALMVAALPLALERAGAEDINAIRRAIVAMAVTNPPEPGNPAARRAFRRAVVAAARTPPLTCLAGAALDALDAGASPPSIDVAVALAAAIEVRDGVTAADALQALAADAVLPRG